MLLAGTRLRRVADKSPQNGPMIFPVVGLGPFEHLRPRLPFFLRGPSLRFVFSSK